MSVQIIARISFILLLFHTLIFIISLARNEIAAHVHDGCWGFKFFLVAASFVASWWIDSSFFSSFYLPIAKFLSVIFLIVQVFQILAAAYMINERLVENARLDTSNCSNYILLGVVITFFGLVILMLVKCYQLFPCGPGITIQSITLGAIILMFILQMTGFIRKDGSVLTHFLVSFYCLYLQWTALSSSLDKKCNINYGNRTNSVW